MKTQIRIERPGNSSRVHASDMQWPQRLEIDLSQQLNHFDFFFSLNRKCSREASMKLAKRICLHLLNDGSEYKTRFQILISSCLFLIHQMLLFKTEIMITTVNLTSLQFSVFFSFSVCIKRYKFQIWHYKTLKQSQNGEKKESILLIE